MAKMAYKRHFQVVQPEPKAPVSGSHSLEDVQELFSEIPFLVICFLAHKIQGTVLTFKGWNTNQYRVHKNL